MSSSSEKSNNDTYIGYIKMKKGGMKIISGDKDDKIISVRNKILSHLNKVFSGGKRLKEKNIKKYFKALGGKYVRNDICSSGNNSNCKGGKKISIEGAHKLLKLISKKNLPIENALEIFKGSAPQLYKKLENKLSGGFYSSNNDDDDNNNDNDNNDDDNKKSSFYNMAKKYASYAKNKLGKFKDSAVKYASYANDKLHKLKDNVSNYANDALKNMKYDETSNYVKNKLNRFKENVENYAHKTLRHRNRSSHPREDDMYGGNINNLDGIINTSLRQQIINIDI